MMASPDGAASTPWGWAPVNSSKSVFSASSSGCKPSRVRLTFGVAGEEVTLLVMFSVTLRSRSGSIFKTGGVAFFRLVGSHSSDGWVAFLGGVAFLIGVAF